jgi:hypothetical protein
MPKKEKKDKQRTSEVSSIITLLNNINDLIVISNKRKEASDVMRALTIYAHNIGYKIPDDKINNFHAILLDSRPVTLSYVIRNIANDILSSYQGKEISEIKE